MGAFEEFLGIEMKWVHAREFREPETGRAFHASDCALWVGTTRNGLRISTRAAHWEYGSFSLWDWSDALDVWHYRRYCFKAAYTPEMITHLLVNDYKPISMLTLKERERMQKSLEDSWFHADGMCRIALNKYLKCFENVVWC